VIRVLQSEARTASRPAVASGCCPYGVRGDWRRGLGLGDGLPEDFLHLFAGGKFVNQLVEVADFAHQRVFDVFDADAADHAFD
jgi:hypothetical protein